MDLIQQLVCVIVRHWTTLRRDITNYPNNVPSRIDLLSSTSMTVWVGVLVGNSILAVTGASKEEDLECLAGSDTDH